MKFLQIALFLFISDKYLLSYSYTLVKIVIAFLLTLFSISLICKSNYKKLFVFKENIKIKDLKVFKHFLFIDKFDSIKFEFVLLMVLAHHLIDTILIQMLNC